MDNIDEDNKKRLRNIISKRKKNEESINNFESDFVFFSRNTLRKVVKEINEQLTASTDESLSISYDDPQNYNLSQNYAQINYLDSEDKNFNNRNSLRFSINNTPTLKFIGQPSNAYIEVYFSRGNFNQKDEPMSFYAVKELDFDKTFQIILDFIERVYSDSK